VEEIQKEETEITENLAYVTRPEPAVSGMFKSKEKQKEIKMERGKKRKRAEEILST
jgi:hypothetical protein